MSNAGPEANVPQFDGGDDNLNRVLAELIGDGRLTLGDDDENDPDFELVEDDDGLDDEDAEAMEEYEEDEDEEEEGDMLEDQQALVVPGKWHEEVKEPKQEGLSLLFSGEFGRLKHQIRSRNKDGDVSKMFLNRGTKIRPPVREDFASVSFHRSEMIVRSRTHSRHKDIVPNSPGTAVASYYSNAYVGQFSSGMSSGP